MKFIAKACGLTRKLSPCEHAPAARRSPTTGVGVCNVPQAVDSFLGV